MIVLGLTGSIGMGKSTTAAMFANMGVPVHDADATVHALYRKPDVAREIEQAFTGTISSEGVNRSKLATYVVGDETEMKKLEAIVHPLVRDAEQTFLKAHKDAGADIVLLDIPLLFETKADQRVDKIVVVSAPASVQRERVLSRPGMTEERFKGILRKQMPDDEKRARADFVIDTSKGIDLAREQVASILEQVRSN